MKSLIHDNVCRRHILLVFVLVWLPTFAGCNQSKHEVETVFSKRVSALEQQTGGIIGVYALDTASGQELAHRPDERFAMASTFKPLLVAAVLAQVDAGKLDLADQFSLQGQQIVSYSPVTGKLGEGQTISLAELCEAAITISDNTAANVLLGLVGGPAGLTQFLQRHGDEITRLDRYEVELNMNSRGDNRDTTTPRAMVQSLSHVLFSDTLSGTSRKQLRDWLVASKTGKKRLRAGLPPPWRVGDKTGSALNGAVNNVAVAWPPGRKPIVIAVYMSWSEQDNADLSAVHAQIAALVVEQFE